MIAALTVAVAALTAVIAVLLAERAAHNRAETADRRHLIDALIAKDARDLALIERSATTPPAARRRDPDAPPPLPEGL